MLNYALFAWKIIIKSCDPYAQKNLGNEKKDNGRRKKEVWFLDEICSLGERIGTAEWWRPRYVKKCICQKPT